MSEIKKEKPTWKLQANIGWVAITQSETCPECNGKGLVGGYFKHIDEPNNCDNCGGKGTITIWPTEPKPELSPELVEHMKKAWKDFFDKNV